LCQRRREGVRTHGFVRFSGVCRTQRTAGHEGIRNTVALGLEECFVLAEDIDAPRSAVADPSAHSWRASYDAVDSTLPFGGIAVTADDDWATVKTGRSSSTAATN